MQGHLESKGPEFLGWHWWLKRTASEVLLWKIFSLGEGLVFVELRGGKVDGEPWWCCSLEWVQWIFPRVSPQQESMPFAVVGSDKEYQVNGKRVLGRKTPWGIIEGKKPLAYGS